ncbi:uncharacterized protein TrAtP1_001952 [Trichoderma atroviride]|uniref:uncharacterized protein n=1 Tax=Hypocrea atroviridis TaxID=63577 RepID=UPI00331FA4AE|nr:hypothetical protein TrAtP1_001952 [Trichoderma atroviride]
MRLARRLSAQGKQVTGDCGSLLLPSARQTPSWQQVAVFESTVTPNKTKRRTEAAARCSAALHRHGGVAALCTRPHVSSYSTSNQLHLHPPIIRPRTLNGSSSMASLAQSALAGFDTRQTGLVPDWIPVAEASHLLVWQNKASKPGLHLHKSAAIQALASALANVHLGSGDLTWTVLQSDGPPKIPCRRNAFIHRDGAYQVVASPSIVSPPAPVALADTTINRP